MCCCCLKVSFNSLLLLLLLIQSIPCCSLLADSLIPTHEKKQASKQARRTHTSQASHSFPFSPFSQSFVCLTLSFTFQPNPAQKAAGGHFASVISPSLPYLCCCLYVYNPFVSSCFIIIELLLFMVNQEDRLSEEGDELCVIFLLVHSLGYSSCSFF